MKKDYSFGDREFSLTQKCPQYKQFQIIQVAGQGTFGVVFKIKHKLKIMALKITLQQKKYRNRELDIISLLKHPSVVSVVDQFFTFDMSEKYLNLVMDYFPNNLYQIIKMHHKKKTRFENQELKIIAFQLFKALAYLEDKMVCHRDLKPQNILINYQTLQTKICDFGSAKCLEKIQNNVVYICSRYYRAPELIFGQSDYQYEIDMWSIGCVLVEMLSLEPIFPGGSNLQQLLQIIKIIGIPSKDDGYDLDKALRKLSKSVKPIKWVNILKFYKADPGYIDLISRILIYNRSKRLRAAQALIHPYFQSIWNRDQNSNIPQNLLDFSSNQFLKYNEQKQQIMNKLQKKQKTGVSIQETGCCTPQN